MSNSHYNFQTPRLTLKPNTGKQQIAVTPVYPDISHARSNERVSGSPSGYSPIRVHSISGSNPDNTVASESKPTVTKSSPVREDLPNLLTPASPEIEFPIPVFKPISGNLYTRLLDTSHLLALSKYTNLRISEASAAEAEKLGYQVPKGAKLCFFHKTDRTVKISINKGNVTSSKRLG